MNSSEPIRGLPGDHEPAVGNALRGWFLTQDPQRVALLHLRLLGAFLGFGLLAAMAMRLELLSPAGDLVRGSTYGALFSLHGMLMFYCVLMPAFPGVLGNALIPPMIGARNVAFPRLNIASWHILAAGGTLVLLSFMSGGTDAGWFFDAAFVGRYTNNHVVTAAIGVALAALSCALMAVNFIATIMLLRPRDLSLVDLPPFVSALLASSLIAVVICPILTCCMAMLVADQLMGTQLFDPATGADPMLFRKLFWMFGTPALYMVVLPALGIVSGLIASRAGRELAGRRLIPALFSVVALASFFLWGQHFLAGAGRAALISSAVSGITGAAIAAVVMMWIATLYRGALRVDASLIYALGFVVVVVFGALLGLGMAFTPTNIQLHNTTYVTAHAHLMTLGILGMAFLAGLHDAWPRIAGRKVADGPARAAAAVVMAGVFTTFTPLIVAGLGGALRRQYAYPPEFRILNVLATAGMTILLAGLGMAIVNLLRRGNGVQLPPVAAATAAR